MDTPSNLGRVIGYPGTDLGVDASISCASPGNCSAVVSTGAKVVAVAQTRGTWGVAQEVPGVAALNVGGDAQISQVSCAAPGACAAGGYYTGQREGRYAFVAEEAGGIWGPAQQVPGLATLNAGKNAQVFSVSCVAPGTCVVGGYYDDASGSAQAFVADEVNGTWQAAQEVPGTAGLNTGRAAEVDSVSCSSPGMCSAAGQYQDGWPARTQLFVVDEVNGSWDAAREVPGLAALNTGGNATVNSVSCPAPGQCSAGGSYAQGSGKSQAFLVDEVNGSWGAAHEVPGLAALDAGGNADIAAMSCARRGECTAVGSDTDAAKQDEAFVVDEVNGSWDAAREVPGLAALNTGGSATVNSVSCPAPGQCSAGGSYVDGTGKARAFLVDEVNGSWDTARQVPGLAALQVGSVPSVDSVSCAAPGECSAVGDYEDGSRSHRAFVVSDSPEP